MESFARTVFRLRLAKWVWACVAGTIAYALMLADVFAYILQALAYQGIFVVAWVAIALAHMTGAEPEDPQPARAINPAGWGPG